LASFVRLLAGLVRLSLMHRMNRLTLFQSYILAAFAILLLNNTDCMGATSPSEHDEKSMQATELFKSGKSEEAIALAKEAVVDKPTDWLPHATLSYFQWYSGQIPAAVSEAKLAATLAPGIEGLETNTGQMALALGDCQTAIPAFERATKIAPDDWAPWLGLVSSHRSAGHPERALACLREMMVQNNKTFEWFYQISEISLQIDEPKLADEAATKALSLAITPEQKSASSAQLLLALLRDNQLDRAKALMDHVFNECHPDNVELYLRCATMLLPVEDPLAGQKFLDCAVENLNDKLNGNGFFRLGSILEEKARDAANDDTKFGAWTDNAERAYRRAVELAPDRAIYHLALASTLNRKGKMSEMTEELSKAQSLDKFDPLAPFLLARLKSVKSYQDHASGQIPIKATEDQPVNIKLTKVDFKINGLSCGCKLSNVRMALTQFNGVAFVATFNQKPYRGTMLIDESTAAINDAFSQCTKNAFPTDPAVTSSMPEATQPAVTLEVESRQPGINVRDAIRLELTAKVGDFRGFPRKPQQPFALIMPVTLDHSGNLTTLR
jgi:tetratricopeptide (TPR) repeat protein